MAKTEFTDTAIIFYSEEDGCWVAHGLHTDQVGTGNKLVAALADLMQAIQAVCDLALADESIAFLREAPPEIQRIAASAKPLPKELSEIAHKMAYGDWPDYLKLDIDAEGDGSFSAEVSEVGCT
jgi:hypothetical protein